MWNPSVAFDFLLLGGILPGPDQSPEPAALRNDADINKFQAGGEDERESGA